MLYIPKGGMCRVCDKWDKDCSEHPFEEMQVIESNELHSLKIVKCWFFERMRAKEEEYETDHVE